MQLRSQSCGPQALCTQSSLPHAQGLAALSRLQGQQPATALAPRTASGCEPCTEGALRSARGLRLFCSAGKGAGKTSRNSSLVSTAKTDLITIKGVGPVNEALLVNRGVDSVKALVNTYHQQANANTHELIKFLQGHVGIKFKVHCQTIADHIEKLASPLTIALQASRVTLCVEGNISAGKSTFLDMIKDTIGPHTAVGQPDMVTVVPEPVASWQNLAGGQNILDAFYKDPQRYAYTFQNYVFLTRCMQERDSNTAALRLLERSVFSDRMVFVRAVHESKFMSDLELSIYNSWFDPMVNEVLPSMVPDGFIYLRATPDVCNTRMVMRNRSEETGIARDYLENLHDKHEQWLNGSRPWADGVLMDRFGQPLLQGQDMFVPAGTQLPRYPPPDKIKDLVVRLTKRSTAHLHDAIVDVPALVLDCESHDLRENSEARADYADKVRTFFKWVKETKVMASQWDCTQQQPSGDLTIEDRTRIAEARAMYQWGPHFNKHHKDSPEALRLHLPEVGRQLACA